MEWEGLHENFDYKKIFKDLRRSMYIGLLFKFLMLVPSLVFAYKWDGKLKCQSRKLDEVIGMVKKILRQSFSN